MQSAAAWERLQATGRLTSTPEFEDPDWRSAYAWLRSRMEARGCVGPRDGGGMVWFWARVRSGDLRQESRRSEHRARGEVVVTARIARERVLLSCYATWHGVLGRSFVVAHRTGESEDEWRERSESAYEAWDAKVGTWGDRPFEEWPPDLRAEVETSWEGIFDTGHHDGRYAVQATVATLCAEDVVTAVRLR